MSKHVGEHSVKEVLKHWRAVAEGDGQDQTFPVATGGTEIHLPLVTLLNADEVNGIPQCQLSEDGGMRKRVHNGVDERK